MRAGRPLPVVQSVFSMMTVIDMFNPGVEFAESGNVRMGTKNLGETNNIVYVFDIDGTLADCSHRLPLIDNRIYPRAKDRNYNRFFDEMDGDTPIEYMVNLCRALIENNEDVVFLTGRPERTRKATVDWLNKNGLAVGIAMTSTERDNVSNLIMRSDDDNRPSEICKRELICEYFLHSELNRALFFEDAPDNVKMMREELNLNVVVVGDGLSFSEGHFEGSWEDD